MASVCGGCLALMDAGVPVTRVVAGVAMGLILDEDGGGDEPVILSDILGLEDGLGTMDFKVAGDATGISTFQLDIKCEGLSIAILERALEQARQGRTHILAEMRRAMPEVRTRLSSSVPKIVSLDVPKASIGKLIGPGGKTIRGIIDDFQLSDMNVGDEGRVMLAGHDDDKLEAARLKIEDMVGSRVSQYTGAFPEAGTLFKKCEVVSVKNFGVFVALGDGYPGLEGLVHVSELHTERVRNIAGFVKPGHVIDVKVLGVSDDGKLKLSRKACLE